MIHHLHTSLIKQASRRARVQADVGLADLLDAVADLSGGEESSSATIREVVTAATEVSRRYLAQQEVVDSVSTAPLLSAA